MAKKLKKSRFSTRKDIIDALLKEDPAEKGFNKYMVIVEQKKISSKLGVIKAELLQNAKVSAKGKMTTLPVTEDEGFDWDRLKVGEVYYQGFSVDLQGQTVGSMIMEGIKKSIKQGKIPYVGKP